MKLLKVTFHLDFDLDLEFDLNTDLILTWIVDADFRTSEMKQIKINVTTAICRTLFYDTLDVRMAELRDEQPSPYTVDVNTLGEIFKR